MSQSNQQPGPLPPAWQVLITSGDDVTSYVVRAENEILAAARAGQEHPENERIEAVDVEPWAESS